MLLCGEHHKMIDSNEEFFKVGYLKELKSAHEQWVREITDISNKQTCQIVSYLSMIDVNEEYFSHQLLRNTIVLSQKYPGSQPIISLNKNANSIFRLFFKMASIVSGCPPTTACRENPNPFWLNFSRKSRYYFDAS